MTEQKLYEWALYEINLPIPELSPVRTRHLKVNNNSVRAIPLKKIPHIKVTPKDPQIFFGEDSLPPSLTSSEIDELNQSLHTELYKNGILCKTPPTPPCDILADAQEKQA